LEYQSLYEVWLREKGSIELQPLGKGFYAEASAFMRAQKEEAQMLDERSLRARLLLDELYRIQKLLTDLIELRFKKISHMIFSGKALATDLLTSEEEVVARGLSTTRGQVELILRNVLRGHVPQITEDQSKRRTRVLIRFLQDIPAIVGPNTRLYGPFKTEDIAALPFENAESLIKRGVAVRVEPE
jgi:DNA replication factor GINS